MRYVMVLTGALILVTSLLAQEADVAADSDDSQATVEAISKWQDMRFGMFIHWGPVSLRGTEIGWSRGREVPSAEYDRLYERFNPTEFDAQQWVATAKAAGMKYLVITSRHHDGFCLWPSKYTKYHIGNSPFKRDVLRELSTACRDAGIQFSTYYSICDWYHPDYPLGSPGGRSKKPNPNMPRYYEFLRNQTRELIESYGPLGIMWFDGEWESPWTREYGNELYDMLKELQPSLIINNRVSKGRHGMAGTTDMSELNAGDYDTPEQRVGGFNRERPWETCMTICRQWAWKPNDNMKSLEQCIQTLLYTVGGDGNLLFNVGPMPDGRIEPRQVRRLKEMGAWLETNGASVYGTRGGPFKPGKWGASTCKDDRVFLFVMQWPAEGPLELPELDSKVTGARLLSDREVKLRQTDAGMALVVSPEDRQEIATVIELTVEGTAFEIEPVDVPYRSASLAYGCKATASNVFQKQTKQYGAQMAVDDDPTTRWATDSGTKEAWLEIELGEPRSVARVSIDEPTEYTRVESFQLQYHDGSSWQTWYEGTSIGPQWSKDLPTVTAQRFRLNILKASDGPTLTEFQLCRPDGAIRR